MDREAFLFLPASHGPLAAAEISGDFLPRIQAVVLMAQARLPAYHREIRPRFHYEGLIQLGRHSTMQSTSPDKGGHVRQVQSCPLPGTLHGLILAPVESWR